MLTSKRGSLTALAAATALSFARPSRADVLNVRSIEFGDWSHTISTLQRTLDAQGATVHVVARDGPRTLRCDEYSLVLDAAGQRAFAIESCEVATSTTALRLIDRTALFEPGLVVARPLAIEITVEQRRQAAVQGGAPAATGGSDLSCSVGVRPYLDDMLRGTRVYLDPVRFELRPSQTTFTAEAQADQWILRGRAALSVDYEIFERATATSVLRGRATLTCATQTNAVPSLPLQSVPRRPAGALYASVDPGRSYAEEQRDVCAREGCTQSRPVEYVRASFGGGVMGVQSNLTTRGIALRDPAYSPTVEHRYAPADVGVASVPLWFVADYTVFTWSPIPYFGLGLVGGLGFGGRESGQSQFSRFYGMARVAGEASLLLNTESAGFRLSGLLGARHVWIGDTSLQSYSDTGRSTAVVATATELWLAVRAEANMLVDPTTSVGIFGQVDAFPAVGFQGGITFSLHTLAFIERGRPDQRWLGGWDAYLRRRRRDANRSLQQE